MFLFCVLDHLGYGCFYFVYLMKDDNKFKCLNKDRLFTLIYFF
jgi:hypothetical protein